MNEEEFWALIALLNWNASGDDDAVVKPVLANGKDLFSHVVEDPKSFPKDMEFEALLYIAPDAYEAKAGKEYNHLTNVSFETGSNSKGWN